MVADLSSFQSPINAVVLGAGGGIGAALVDALADNPHVAQVLALSRRALPDRRKVQAEIADVTDERSLAAAAARAPETTHLVIVATGMLHAGEHAPEKQLRDLGADRLAYSFAVNAIGPALALKHFTPLMPRQGKAVFAALSARVGSISDNRSGGWYGYRASKAALNMLLRTAAIEIGAKRKDAVILGLHPGTVDTGLSKPFQANVKPEKLFTPAFAAERLLAVIDDATPAQTGTLLAWDGAAIPF
jgi:NAD(P)-dependent dehydrogenase (short-subunit alcohol dehydrogenase family)